MTAVVSTRCRRCGAELHDRFSRKLGYGPECRKDLSPDQLVAAIRANQPGVVPAATLRPTSTTARRNHAEVQRVTAPVVAAKRCPHEDIPAQCALCRRDNDPARAAERIITLAQRMPRGERLEAERAASVRLLRAYLPAGQLAIGGPT